MREKVQASSEQVGKALEVAQTSIEAVEYLVEKVGPERVGESAEYAKFQHLSNAQPWFCEMPNASNFMLMYENIGKESAKAYKAENLDGRLEFNYAVGPGGELTRAYAVNGSAAPPKAVGYLDRMLQAFMAENKFALKAGTPHQIDKNGSPLPKQEVSKGIIEDLLKTFGDFLKNKGISATVNQQVYRTPKEESVSKPAQTPTAGAKEGATKEQSQTPKASG